MKRLPPSFRPDYRYLKFKVHCDEKEIGELVDAVWNSALDYLGTSGAAQADFWIIGNKYSEEDGEGVIRVKKDKKDDLRAALTLLDSIGEKPGFIEIMEVSGALNSLE